MEIKLVPATKDDSRFIAWIVMAAFEDDLQDNDLVDPVMVEICEREDTLYSWRNTILAKDGDKVVGAIISYPGEDYMQKRLNTFSIFHSRVGQEREVVDIESGAGEYYLDSIAVLNEYRGHGIARILMEAAIQKGKELGYEKVTLIVADNKPNNRAMYEHLGFSPISQLTFWDEPYTKMEMRVTK